MTKKKLHNLITKLTSRHEEEDLDETMNEVGLVWSDYLECYRYQTWLDEPMHWWRGQGGCDNWEMDEWGRDDREQY